MDCEGLSTLVWALALALMASTAVFLFIVHWFLRPFLRDKHLHTNPIRKPKKPKDSKPT